jgi:hypothetical protein
MKPLSRTLWTAAALLVSTTAAYGQPAPPAADLTGTWMLEATEQMPNPEARSDGNALVLQGECAFSGSASVTQDAGGALSGDATLNLQSGDAECPTSMTASLTGSVEGSDVTMGMMVGGGMLGEAIFDGTIGGEGLKSGPAIADRAVTALTVTGNNSVTSGPFTDVSGTFSAVVRQSVVEIPTLGPTGLIALIGLLCAAGALVLARRPAMR